MRVASARLLECRSRRLVVALAAAPSPALHQLPWRWAAWLCSEPLSRATVTPALRRTTRKAVRGGMRGSLAVWVQGLWRQSHSWHHGRRGLVPRPCLRPSQCPLRTLRSASLRRVLRPELAQLGVAAAADVKSAGVPHGPLLKEGSVASAIPQRRSIPGDLSLLLAARVSVSAVPTWHERASSGRGRLRCGRLRDVSVANLNLPSTRGMSPRRSARSTPPAQEAYLHG